MGLFIPMILTYTTKISMKYFFQEYLAIALYILLSVLLAPTAVFGDLTIAMHIFGALPNSTFCQNVKK